MQESTRVTRHGRAWKQGTSDDMVSSFGFDDMLLSIHRDRKWFIPVVHQRQDKMVFLQPKE